MHLIFHMLRWYFHKQFMTYLRSMNFPMRLVPSSRVLSLYTSNSKCIFLLLLCWWPLFQLFKFFKIFGFFSAYIQVTHVITQSNIEKDFLHFSAILITDFNQTSMNFIIISILIHQLIQIGNLVEINFFSWKFSANLKYNSQFFIAKNAPYF